MTPWPIVRLGDLAEFRNGLNFTKQQWGKGLPVVGVSNFQDYATVRFDELDELDQTALGSDESLLRLGDILFVRSNGNRDLIGRSMLVAMEPPKPTSYSGFTIRLRFKNKDIDPRFYAYLFRGSLVRQTLSSHGGGTNISNLNQEILASLHVPTPSFALQRRIADILSAYDELIENNMRRIAILEEMARRVYEEWFVHYKYPNSSARRYTIPAGWEVRTVSETFEILGGGTPSKAEPSFWEAGSINWYTPSDLTRSCSVFAEESELKINIKGLAKSSARLFPAFSVMMTSRATIGEVSVNTTEAATNQGFITCLPNDTYPLWLLYHWVKTNVPTFISLGTGSTFKEIIKGTFKGIKLVVPPRPIAQHFNSTIAPMMEMILTLQRSSEHLRGARDLLLPRLISGEIEVSETPMPGKIIAA